MDQNTSNEVDLTVGSRDVLTEILRQRAPRMLQEAIEAEVGDYLARHAPATECLNKDRDVRLTFYDFPAEHWVHLRTTNPIESTFATVRLRTAKTKGCGSRVACLTMVYKLARCAESHWRGLNGSELLDDVIRGVRFVDGIKEIAA